MLSIFYNHSEECSPPPQILIRDSDRQPSSQLHEKKNVTQPTLPRKIGRIASQSAIYQTPFRKTPRIQSYLRRKKPPKANLDCSPKTRPNIISLGSLPARGNREERTTSFKRGGKTSSVDWSATNVKSRRRDPLDLFVCGTFDGGFKPQTSDPGEGESLRTRRN